MDQSLAHALRAHDFDLATASAVISKHKKDLT